MHPVLKSLVPVVLAAVLPSAGWAAHHEGEEQVASSRYTTAETPLGRLFDDPDAMIVLETHVPGLIANEQIRLARQITLRDIQGFAPEALSDETLDAIDKDFAKLPAK